MLKFLALTSVLAMCSAGAASANEELQGLIDDPNQWAIQTGDYKKTGKYLNLSTECKDLISQVFTIDPDQRINGQQALDHPWFAEFQLGRQLSCDVGAPSDSVL